MTTLEALRQHMQDEYERASAVTGLFWAIRCWCYEQAASAADADRVAEEAYADGHKDGYAYAMWYR